uniref:Endonuclease/exonuclease/phosphatase domain-containing protein n=1 Tax=Takifugu rubripes TaxID=31033 RepID=A0A674NTS8_TAKRU
CWCVATLFSPRLDVRVTSTTEIAAGRALAVRAEVQGFVFCLINIYAPSQGSDRLDLFQKVSSFLEQCGQDECVVMGGDWNCTTDVTLDRIGQEPHLQSAAVLSRLGAELGMVDVWRLTVTFIRLGSLIITWPLLIFLFHKHTNAAHTGTLM